MVSSLIGRAVPGIADPGHPFVLLAIDLAPADAAGLDATHCLGIATEQGGLTSHTAIIARSLGIPAVVAANGLTAIPDGTLVLLDAGTDKVLPFLGQTAEAKPALGVRGFRIVESYPELLHDQLTAIKEAAASQLTNVWVMALMISTVGETRSFVQAARAAGLPITGVMIETPAAALQTELILAEVDFVSIGTNDLAQYVFVADRHSAPLAVLNDPWQPALLRMIEMVT